MNVYDVIIIGAGVSGCAVARELSRTQRRILVLERASDVCEGTSKANSGIVHAGYDAVPGTLKARLNVLGNEKMEELSKELDFPFKRNGSLVLCFEEEGKEKLKRLMERGRQNGVRDIRILEPKEITDLEPNLSKEAAAALYAPTGGIVCPFGMNIALAENACDNGVEFLFDHRVEKISRIKEGYLVETACMTKGRRGVPKEAAAEERGTYEKKETFCAPVIINAAGVYADELHNMVSGHKMKIVPRRGEYCLMDKKVGQLVHSTVFQLPTRMGKGILVTPTVHGNLLVGPTAEDISDKEGVCTTQAGLARVLSQGANSVPELSARQVITSFAGLRAHGEGSDDFIIGEPSDAPGFFDVAGIESPGLTCAPAIGEYVAELVNEKYPALPKKDFQPKRKGIPGMAQADEQTRRQLIEEDCAYANVICRCELVTEGEIVNAIHRTLGAVTLDGVKRRVRAGMGRCQSGFCSPKVVEILARELGLDEGEITKAGGSSGFLTGENKEKYRDAAADSEEKGGPEKDTAALKGGAGREVR